VALIDHQGQMLFGTSNFDRQGIINNTVAFGKAARVFDVPVVLTTVETKSFSGNMWPQLRAVFPGREPIERSSMNSWDDKNFVAAIEKKRTQEDSHRRPLDGNLCCLADSAGAFMTVTKSTCVEDCCGDVSQLAHDNAMKRVIQAGAKPVTSLSTMLEWQRDWAHKETYDGRDGHREEPLRSLWDRRRVRVHDGTRRAGHEIPGVRGSRCSCSSQ